MSHLQTSAPVSSEHDATGVMATDTATAPPPEYSQQEGKPDVLPSYEEVTGTQNHSSRPLIAAEPASSLPVARRRQRRCLTCKNICFWFVIAIIFSIAGGIIKVVLDKKADARLNPKYKNLKYRLVNEYSGDTFFDNFDFYTDSGSESFTSSFVNETEARRRNIASVLPNGDVSLSISSNVSARIVSKQTFSSGLFAFELIKSPRHCSCAPTLRLSSSAAWPAENDIRIHYHQADGYSNQGIRTSGYCNMAVRRQSSEKARIKGTKCNLPENDPDKGCRNPNSWLWTTRPENSTLIMELQPAGVRFWHSYYGLYGLSQNMPDTSRWGTPDMDFPSTDCDMQTYFRDLRLVADINVCGDYGFWGSNGYEIMGDWCEKRCNPSDPFPGFNWTAVGGRGGRKGYESNAWQFKSWKIYQAVEDERS